MKNHIIMFLFGAYAYGLIEVLWRGYTHWSMAIAGGVCFLLLHGLNRRLIGKVSYLSRCILGGLTVTAVELIAGVVLNLWWKLDVWDYSALPMNLWGQICLPFTLLWCALMLVVIGLEQMLRFRMLGEVYGS